MDSLVIYLPGFVASDGIVKALFGDGFSVINFFQDRCLGFVSDSALFFHGLILVKVNRA